MTISSPFCFVYILEASRKRKLARDESHHLIDGYVKKLKQTAQGDFACVVKVIKKEISASENCYMKSLVNFSG